MAGINFLSDNQLDNAALSITTGSANVQFPLSNIQNESPSLKFRSVGNTVVILADMTTTRTIDALALVGDPTGTFGLTSVEFKFSGTTDFSSSMAYNPALDSTNNFGFLIMSTTETARYAQITLTGTGTYSEISNIFIGQKINLTQINLTIDSFKYGYKDKSVIRKNRYGQHFIDERNRVKFLSGSLEYLNKTEQESIDDMYIRHGRSKPIWMIVDAGAAGMNSGQYKLSIYGYFNRSPRWSFSGGFHYSSNLRIDEAI